MPHHDPHSGEGHYRPGPDRSQPLPPRPPRPSRRPSRRPGALGRTATAVLGVTAVAGALVAVALSDPADETAGRTSGGSARLAAVADTYVVEQRPGDNRGDQNRLTASRWPDWNTETYVAFEVPKGQRVRSARVEVTLREDEAHRPPRIELRTLPASWDERATSWENRPTAGPVIATSGTEGRRASFDVSAAVSGPGRYAFAITNPGDDSGAALYSREAGQHGPRLLVNHPAPPPPPAPSPTRHRGEISATARPTPSATPSRTAAPSPSPAARRPAGNLPLCGVSLFMHPGETWQQTLTRTDAMYGGLETVRLFYRGVPPAWPGNPDLGKRPPIISFKLSPRDVLAGRHDADMTRWFTTAPRDRDVYWIFYHEPEDNIAKGEFTASDYRAAWRHLRKLADRADNPRLHATLVLMGWSLTAESKRNWRDYYPGRDVIQVLGWDVYNLSDKKGIYDSPSVMYDQVVAVSRKEGLPFGIAETGSYLLPGDNGTRRAEWIRATNDYLRKHGALWVAYFDLDWPTGDFRLTDQHGRKAWRDFCN